MIDLDVDGDDIADIITTDLTAPLTYTYTTPGAYTAKVTVMDSLGNLHNAEFTIIVFDGVRLDAQFRTIWDGMNNSLLAGDVTAATTHLTISAGEKYQPVFTALLPYMTEIVDSYSLLRRVDMSPEIAEYAVNRQINGEDHIFIINFLPDENGIWRIDGM